MRHWVVAATVAAGWCWIGAASAAPRHVDVHVREHVDVRFGHNHSYVDRGVIVDRCRARQSSCTTVRVACGSTAVFGIGRRAAASS
jgi:hypothetical protein